MQSLPPLNPARSDSSQLFNSSSDGYQKPMATLDVSVMSSQSASGLRPDGFPETSESDSFLRLSGQNLGDKGLKPWIQRMKTTGTYKALFLANNQIGNDGAKLLAQLLKNDTTVQHLILSGNKITDFAVAALADMLKVNHKIGWVVLNQNRVSGYGAELLAEALCENDSVENLILADNQIDDSGSQALSAMLIQNSTLKTLFLQGNPIGEKGVTSLLEHFSQIKLNILDLRDISSKGSAVLQRTVPNLPTGFCRVKHGVC